MIDVGNIVKEFSDDLEKAVQTVMVSDGVDKKSDLIKSIEFKEVNGVFVMLANDYYEYVSTGRRRGARKVPIMDLVQWIKDKRISTRGSSINALAFAIQTSIYKNGIKGKNFINQVDEVFGDVAEIKLAEGLEESILSELDKTFK